MVAIGSDLYQSEGEAQMHEAAMEALAGQVRLPLPEVRAVYEEELRRLLRDARIRDFVSVVATRRARIQLGSH